MNSQEGSGSGSYSNFDINKSVIVKGFNNHFEEFIEDIQSIFPEDDEVRTMKNLLFMLKKQTRDWF